MTGRWLPPAVAAVGVAFGLAAEWAAYDSDAGLAAADLVVGCVLVAAGAAAWSKRPDSRVGLLLCLAGYAWFLGTLFAPALYLHRGFLVHAVLSYPTGRVSSRFVGAVVVASYGDSAIEPLAANDWLTLALAVVVAAAAVLAFVTATGPARAARLPALAAALAFAAVLVVGAIARLGGWEADRTVLWSYDLVVACLALVLATDLIRSRWSEAVVTGLIVDLGTPREVGTLRARLARALGDPSLVLGYRLEETAGLVDEAGRAVALPAAGSGRVVTPIDDGGRQVGVLVHDEAVLADPKLVEAVAAGARITMANARLQVEERTRAAELEASRRRIVEAADAQRRRLEEELRLGAERRLETVAALLAGARRTASENEVGAIGSLEADLGDARRELREYASGIHPAQLADDDLGAALARLAGRTPIPVHISGALPPTAAPVAAALFFVCSEALANVVKHAGASQVTIELGARGDRVAVAISDDGAGGASLAAGSGLGGLADRVEALGGRLQVESPTGAGTRIAVELPRAGVSASVSTHA